MIEIHKVFRKQNKIATWGFGIVSLFAFISCFFITNSPEFYFCFLAFIIYFGLWMVKTVHYNYDSCGCRDPKMTQPALDACNRLYNERKMLSCNNCMNSLVPTKEHIKLGKYLVLSMEKRNKWWNLEEIELFRKIFK